MRKYPFLLIFIFLLVSLLFADSVFLEYSATPATNKVTITWVTKSEGGVSKFSVLRSDDDNYFSEIGTITAKGSGNDYVFIDENVIFKSSETFFYKIRALSSDNSTVEETQSLIVNPNISGIFRTWGAIKAIFR